MGLTKRQLAELERLMDAQQAKLTAEVREELEESKSAQQAESIDHLPTEDGDESIGDALVELNLVIVDRHAGALRELERARERIRDGTFGYCIDCDDDIAFARLKSYPTATRCILCQEKRERTYAHEAHPTL